MLTFLFELLILGTVLSPGLSNHLRTARNQHRSQSLTNNELRYLSTLTDSNYIDKVLDNILIPRVVGTENHEKVFNYIVDELKPLTWQVDVDEFTDKVPIFGNLKFKNIIATSNPDAQRFLVFACHYDSKYFKNAYFVGAIDSAVPCAMMLEIAKSLSREIHRSRNTILGLKLIFFDGEEAFENWGPNDSIYGAKHLAKQLRNNRSRINGEEVTELDKMDLLVLLDLIGHKNPTFMSFFQDTQRWFGRLVQIEDALHNLNLLKKHKIRYFQTSRPYGRIEDDHLPFMERGVPILHLISAPFPPEWHTPRDNRDIVDMNTVYNVNLILKTFISEYLHLFQQEIRQKPEEKAVTESSANKINNVELIVYPPIFYFMCLL